MPYLPRRRSRTLDVDEDEEDSRPQTPASTAPNDRKRIRQSTGNQRSDAGSESESEFESEDGVESVESLPAAAPEPDGEERPTLVNGPMSTGSHQGGAIVRVKLTNFVTYSSAEFFPGPGLNMVIGPNGTGKSTLVCAICLGLGWGTQYLGRAKDAAEFVKHGCSEATIEIELQRPSTGKLALRRNPVFRRTIKRDGNKSNFFINNSQSTAKGVQQYAKAFNIQIDNLCQFLPQDKVVEFAQMSPIEILESTQKAAAAPEMIQIHQELKKLRVDQKELLHANRGDREHLENLQRRQEMSRTEVERMKERAVAKKKLGWLEMVRPVPLYGAAKDASKAARDRQKVLAAELRQLRHDSDPALRKVNAKEAYKKEVEKWRNEKKGRLAETEKDFDNVQKSIQELNTKSNDCDAAVIAERKSARDQKDSLVKVHQSIAKLENARQHKPEDFDSRAMNQQIQDLKAEGRLWETRKEDAQSRATDLKTQGTSRKDDIGRLSRSLEGLETQTGQREGRLEEASRDTSRAWRWVQDNQNLFEQKVYGPPLIECSLDDTKWADTVETFLQKSDFLILTAQNQRDFMLLQKKLNTEMNLHDVRIRTCSETSLDGYRKPLTQAELEDLGFSSYAIDHLVGPPTVLAMLCNEKRLHSCAIAARDISQQNHERASKSALSAYCSRTKRYQFIHRKEYGDAGSLARVGAVMPAEHWTNQPVDMGRKASFERRIAEIKGELDTIREELKECAEQERDAVKKMKDLDLAVAEITSGKEEKQKALTQWNSLPARIKQEREKELQHKQFLEGVNTRVLDLIAKKDQYQLEIGQKIVQLAAATAPVKDAQAALIEAEIMLVEAKADFEFHADRSKHILESIETKTREEKEAMETAQKTTEQARKLVKACQDIRAESMRVEETEGDMGFTELLAQMGRETWSTERLDAEIDSQKAQIELTEGGNANVIKEYEERAKQIEKLESRLTNFNQRQADFQEKIKKLRDAWQPELEALVEKISTAFGDSFARIGCAGQVAVHKASSEDPVDCIEENGGHENGLDFANWAIHISVKFRETEALSLLDSHRQSGGERAVSTIFYLMALQSLSRAPFRVVDEINQGMDPRNERMVHGRMVDIATDEGGSQYFLITPKLLSGLKYRRGMTVLCIVSGENVPGETGKDPEDGTEFDLPKINFKDFVRKAKSLGYGDGTAGRRTDSGVGLDRELGSGFSREGSRMTSVGA